MLFNLFTIDHAGRFFRVRGPLNLPRSPQGHPVLVQAGSSEDGKDFAARYAEAVFTAQQTLAEGQAFYADLKRRAAAAGRDPAGVKVLPGIVPVLGSTEAEARALEAELDRLILAEAARERLAHLLHVDPAQLPLDKELPGGLPAEDEIEGAKSRYTLIVELARRERLTVRQLIGRLGRPWPGPFPGPGDGPAAAMRQFAIPMVWPTVSGRSSTASMNAATSARETTVPPRRFWSAAVR
jgi:alkanesulfonate monooxygenase SsuD/methylene tetrahydromethanopterin reductase-like flavin-dependent oxidoreductase (luciferase family)